MINDSNNNNRNNSDNNNNNNNNSNNDNNNNNNINMNYSNNNNNNNNYHDNDSSYNNDNDINIKYPNTCHPPQSLLMRSIRDAGLEQPHLTEEEKREEARDIRADSKQQIIMEKGRERGTEGERDREIER